MVNTASSMVEETRVALWRTAGRSAELHQFCALSHLTLNNVLRGFHFREGDTLYVSPYEHNAVWRCALHLENQKNKSRKTTIA